MSKKRIRLANRLHFLPVFIIAAAILISGCSHLNEGLQAGESFKEANDLFSQGNYNASLSRYQLIREKHPASEDRALFEMGIIYSYPSNDQKDYRKALECFQKLVKNYPESSYRKDSELMIFNIRNVVIKDKTIDSLQAQIESLQKESGTKESAILGLKKKIDDLERELKCKEDEIGKLRKEVISSMKEPADKIVIEKKERRLSLLSRGMVLKTYRIALGGNPVGPKERQGDNRTPEGTYIIDSRNDGSLYHLALHISYPNDRDRKRAKHLGVPPGGNIMIHGVKNGLEWVGELQASVDWTKGCIAVTNDEIEEIAKLAPNGTVVEIRP